MKKTFALLFFLFISAVAAMQAQVQFKVTQKRVSPTEVDLIFTGTIARGWHVYSTDVEDGGPTKATFTSRPSLSLTDWVATGLAKDGTRPDESRTLAQT